MRWVILAVVIALFLIWDGLKNDSEYTRAGITEINHLLAKLR